jgi:peptidoglycan/LPS O-acetylase OafA/YrhL
MGVVRRSVMGERLPKATLPHVRALDGLRGLAVAAVLLFHGGHLIGGYLGVDVFFVLSGFLITSLLLAESTATGRLGLGGFWARRARRLLPALGGVLVGVALYCLVFADASELANIRGGALVTIGYAANWRSVFARQDYWALFTVPSPLDHTWSLAIEEQFYMVWPLVFVGLLAWWKRSTPVAVLVTSIVLACVSSALMFSMYNSSNPSRVYYGTDTRAGGIVFGAALAAWLAWRGHAASGRARVVVEVVAVIGAGVVALAWSRLSGESSGLYRGGFLVCELATVAVLAAAVHPRPGPVARTLSFRPLRLLGLISYGVYLWHWPVDVVLSQRRTGLSGWWMFGLQTAITLVIAALSFVLLEQPIRRGALSGHRWRALTPAIAIGLVLVLVATTARARTHPAVASSGNTIASALDDVRAAPPRTKRVMIVGNSVAYFVGDAFTHVRTDPPIVTLNAALIACYFPDNLTVVRFPGFHELRSGPCSSSWQSAIEQFRPDIVLWMLSGAGDGQAEFRGHWAASCDPDWDTNFDQGLRQAIATLGTRGAKVVITTAAYNRYGYVYHDREVDCDNRVRRMAAASAGAPIIDLFSRICPHDACLVTENGVTLRPDGIHYEGPGAQVIAAWLIEQLHIQRLLP